MKGYRTIVASFATILLGLIGKHVSPELLNQYLDVIFAVIGLGFLMLRLVTNTPFGAAVAADFGTSAAAINTKLAAIDPDIPADLNTAVDNLNAAVGTLVGHPLLRQPVIASLTTLAASLPATTDAAAAPAPAPTPQPAAPQPTLAPAAPAPTAVPSTTVQ